MKRQFRLLLVAGGTLAVGVGVAIAVRAQMLPCGWLDRDTGCTANVRLNLQDLDFISGTIEVSYGSFDLSAGAETVLVGLEGLRPNSNGEGRHNYGVLALFDTRNGDLVRVLRDVEDREGSASSHSSINEVALSLDGQLAASSAIVASENILNVQRTSDGEIVHQLVAGSPDSFSGCIGQLDFSPDNQLLQCGFNLYQLKEGTPPRLLAEDIEYPRLSDFSVSNKAVAPDGTRVEFKEIQQTNGDRIPFEPPLHVLDARRTVLMFAPDSTRFLEVWRVSRTDREQQRLIPPPFRQLSTIAVWTVDAERLHVLDTNTRVRRLAWSRDSQYFALLNQNLNVQVFRAPDLPEE